MRSKKLWTAFLILLLIAVAAASLYFSSSDGGGRKRNMNLYFLNAEQTSIVAEKREIKYRTASELPDEVLNALIKGPLDSKLARLMDDTVKVNSLEMIKGDIIVDFSREYMSGDSAKDILTTYAVVKSLCEIPEIDRVKVSVEGENITSSTGTALDFLSSDDIKLENENSSNEERTVRLYFADSEGNKLIAEDRTITITDKQPIEQYIVNELIKGPAYSNMSAVLSADTAVISVETKDGICFVNLMASFITKNSGGSAKETLAVYSIVNSLTELDEVNSVQFLIDGKKIDEFGHFGFSEPFERNEVIIGEK